MHLVVILGPVLTLIAQTVGIVSTCVGVWMSLQHHTRPEPEPQRPVPLTQSRAIPHEVVREQASSLPQLAHRLFKRRLALCGIAVTLVVVIILLGREVLAKQPAPLGTSISAFGIATVTLLLVIGLLAVDPLLTSTWRHKRRLALGSAAWVLSLTSAPITPYVIAMHQFTWAPVVLSGTVLATLIALSILALDPWSGPVLPLAYGLALGTIVISSLVSAVLLLSRAPWWKLDQNLEYAFFGIMIALFIVTGILLAEYRTHATANVSGPVSDVEPAL